MIKRLIHFTLHQPMFIALMTVLFIGGGIIAFKRLPIEAFPDVSDVQATVITLYPGRAPEEVEKQVTIPLEVVLSGLPHSVRLFSHTQFGLSYIVITFDDQVTDYFARQQVGERCGLPLRERVRRTARSSEDPIGLLDPRKRRFVSERVRRDRPTAEHPVHPGSPD